MPFAVPPWEAGLAELAELREEIRRIDAFIREEFEVREPEGRA